MGWIRYSLYFVGITLLIALLTRLEIAFPGTLQLQVIPEGSGQRGTSEYSLIEMIQPVILAVGGLLMAWVARYCPSQRPVAFPFGFVALAFLLRELDYFFDRVLPDNFWQVLTGVAAALVIAYTFRQRLRLRIALARLWPAPGFALLFAGAVIVFSFGRLFGHEPLWMAIMGDDYQRVVKLAVEEFLELLGYLFWLTGAIEYAYQARAIAYREPQPAAQRRREKRRQDSAGRF